MTSKQTKSEFWASLKRTSDELEYERNLRGRTTRKCTACKNGEERPGRIDHDGSGSFWVSGTVCRVCGGYPHSVEVACSPEAEAKALEVEIGTLKARLRDARKRAQKAKAP